MNYADAIRRQAEEAPRAALPAVTAALWRAFAEGHVTEAEAEALSALVEARQVKSETLLHLPQIGNADVTPVRVGSPRRAIGSRPRTDASMERRRRWAASGRLPPGLAARFTLAEQAALALIAAETARRGDCRLAIEHLAAVAGVSRSTVKNAIREARKLGLLTVEERRLTAFRNDTNVVRIVSPEWTAWLRLGRKGVTDRAPLGHEVVKRHPITPKGVANRHLPQGGGVKSVTGTPTQILKQGKTRTEGLTSRSPARAEASPRGASWIAGA
jgi:hypothetical protein